MDRISNYRTLYRTLFNLEPPTSISYGESKADIISKGRGFVSAFDFTMQLQVGCPGGCLFCYVPAADILTPGAVKGQRGENWGFLVRDKLNVPQRLKEYLDKGELADKTIYWSGVTDPYTISRSITRGIWETLISTPPELRPRRIKGHS